MSQAVINVRVDKADKLAFEEFCYQTGLNISVAINMFVKAVINKGCIPFSIEQDPFYSSANQARLQRSIEHLKRGELTEHELILDEDER